MKYIFHNVLNTVPEKEGPDPPMLDEFPVDSGLDLRLAVEASYGLRFLANLRGQRHIQCHRGPLLILDRRKLLLWLFLHVNLLLTHC